MRWNYAKNVFAMALYYQEPVQAHAMWGSQPWGFAFAALSKSNTGKSFYNTVQLGKSPNDKLYAYSLSLGFTDDAGVWSHP